MWRFDFLRHFYYFFLNFIVGFSMCGIVGAFSFASVLDGNDITLMADALWHRGPDHTGFYRDDYVNLGSTRLSFNDVENGNQPIYNEDNSVVTVLNGEIYNFIALRNELLKTGHIFKTNTDTEVLVHLYEEYGTSLLSKLEGQFAFAIFDKNKMEIFLARDRVGICPLYYYVTDDTFYFSSEIKSFSKLAGFHPEPDFIGLMQSLKYWTTIAPRTVFSNVKSLPVAHKMVVHRNGNKVVDRYHQLSDYKDPNFHVDSVESLKERVREALYESTKRRMFSDTNVKIGAYVSGGVDSAIVSHLVDKIGMNDFTTFSLAFEDKQCDESRYQNDCVLNLHSDHIELRVNHNDIVAAFPKTIQHTEAPIFRTAPVPMYLLSQKVNQHGHKAVLTGEGADEIFFGYDVFKEVMVRRFWANQPRSSIRPQKLKDVFYHIEDYKNPVAFEFLKGFYTKSLESFESPSYSLLPQWQNGGGLFSFFNKAAISSCISEKNETFDLELFSLMPSDLSSLSDLKKCQSLQMELLLSGYLLSSQGDRILSANSVEGRFPFLDENVIALAYNIPDTLKLYGLNEKYILREAFKGRIPESIRTRRKFGYRAPEAKVFFLEQEIPYVDYLLSDELIELFGIFDPKMVGLLVNKFKSHGDISKFSMRDNLAMTFILSTQMVFALARNKFELPW